ncbi:MAG: hypothetical protein WA177_02180, partial [Xanthobacteraceae bacterium]
MILRRPSRPDPRLVLGSALALALPFGAEFGASSVAFAQAPSELAPTGPAAVQGSTTASPAPAPGAPPANTIDALKQHDQELGAALARQRAAVEGQAKLRIEIEGLSQDRTKFNQDLIGTAARVRGVEANIDATRARLEPLDEQEKLFRKSLADRRGAIAEILAALQRVGRQPPPALLVRPEDALQAVRTAITLGAVVPEMRAQADALAGDLAELVRVRKKITSESDRLSGDLDLLGHEQLRLTLLIDERQKKEAAAEQALGTERQNAADLGHQVGSIKDLITK